MPAVAAYEDLLRRERLEGLGYVPPFESYKSLRNTETGACIEFLVQGDFPATGNPTRSAPGPDQ